MDPQSISQVLPGGASARMTLQAHGLKKSFGGAMAVDDVSFEVGEGEMLALIGPNGAGKSTCFNMIGGQFAPTEGKILLRGPGGEPVSIAGASSKTIFRLGVGRTFQITSTFTSMTVQQNVQMALIARRNLLWRFWKRANDLLQDEAYELLTKVGLQEQANRQAGVLAYGDLKRLELAIALAGEPKLLLMDEPTAGMASGERTALMALVRRLVSTSGISVLFTEHDMDVVFDVSDRILVLDRGRLIASGNGDEIKANEQVRAIYLGSGRTSGGH